MIELKTFPNGFRYLEIHNPHAHAKIALQGAHLFEYKAEEKPALVWCSEKAYFESGKAIRGGIPVCFPWFGKHKDDATLPQHGFGRTQEWRVVSQKEMPDGSTSIALQLTPNALTLSLWPFHFEATMHFRVGKMLDVALEVKNTDSKPFELGAALHTYFAVSNICEVSLHGLKDKVYYDNLSQTKESQKGELIIDKEIDRVYSYPEKTIILQDDTHKTTIQQTGSNSTVVWNPWTEKSKQLADMNDEGYKTFVCIETANALEDVRVLQPLQVHRLQAVYSQEGIVKNK
jgi:D-hexose-6-phosphate mutarotase